MSQNPKRGNTTVIVVLITLIVLMIAATAFLIYLSIDLVNKEPEVSPSQGSAMQLPQTSETKPKPEPTEPEETEAPTTEAPEVEQVVATATVGTIGDLLMHSPIFNSCKQSDGSYNFESVFRYGKDTFSALDYAIANLETTFGGPDHPHVPNVHYSCPDQLADSAVEAGFDMFQTINNHSGDSNADGLIRTLEVTRAAGLATLGTQLPGEKPYAIVEVNGIKIGMVGYTWAFEIVGDRFSLNGMERIKYEGQANYYSKQNPDKLYNELKPIMENMKADGAEATMIFIHWGEEYETRENAAQDKMAQKLCDIGFDVIVGGHPHVVQPMALLQSTENPDHKTFCIFSLGNAVSNQRDGISSKFSGYTEDGLLFNVTFEKYSDGKVYVSDLEAIPMWVNMHSNNGGREYNILPLNKQNEDQWKETYKMTDGQFSSAQKSYDRTMKIIGEGLTACQEYLTQAKADRDAYYANPEAYVQDTIAETTLPDAA